MTDNNDNWRDVSLEAQLLPFPRLNANVAAILQLIEGPKPRAEVVAALDRQAWRHEKQLRLMCRLFAEQLVAVREVVRKAARNEIRADFAEAGLVFGAQEADADEDKEEGELLRASMEDVN